MPQLARRELGEAKKLEGVAMLRSPPSSVLISARTKLVPRRTP
jgi:hypothetical protein